MYVAIKADCDVKKGSCGEVLACMFDHDVVAAVLMCMLQLLE
jgi:hypothetical protein